MKKKLQIAVIAISAMVLVGCDTNPQWSTANKGININPAALVGTNSTFNAGTWNPALVFEALSQLPQTGTLNIVGPGVNFSGQRNMPPGYVALPIIPLTPDRAALVEGDFIAAQVYGMRNDHSSQDITVVGGGWTISFHLAYPPSTLNGQTTTAETNSTPVVK